MMQIVARVRTAALRLESAARVVEPELLDELPPSDPQAIHSRRDLTRLNGLMGHARILSRFLKRNFAGKGALKIAEVGAGDGEFLLSVARSFPAKDREISAVLVDQQELVSRDTVRRFAEHGWKVQPVKADAWQWLRQSEQQFDLITANLFLHHFRDAALRELLGAAAARSDAFLAMEPRRAKLPLLLSRCLRVIGCGPVTRNDAPISVRAGFAGRELSTLWPEARAWNFVERRVGLFTHLFEARRRTDKNAFE